MYITTQNIYIYIYIKHIKYIKPFYCELHETFTYSNITKCIYESTQKIVQMSVKI